MNKNLEKKAIKVSWILENSNNPLRLNSYIKTFESKQFGEYSSKDPTIYFWYAFVSHFRMLFLCWLDSFLAT